MKCLRCKPFFRKIFLLVTTVCFSMVMLKGYVEGRVGGGSSSGSRGSRSYQPPVRPSQPAQPTQPRREATPPPQQPNPVGPQPAGFGRSIAGGLLGGFLGGMLFSGMAGGGIGGSGIGLIEILLLAGLGYFIYSMVRRPVLETGYGTVQYQSTGYPSAPESEAVQAPPAFDELDFTSVRILDPAFDPARFVKSAQDIFFKAQAAWSRQDAAMLASLCTPELARSWEQELVEFRSRGQRNCIENIALRGTEITEVWTENGQDYIMLRFEADLLDYTIDEKSGQVINGSKADPVDFEEFWTLTRAVGPNPWKLTAIQQP